MHVCVCTHTHTHTNTHTRTHIHTHTHTLISQTKHFKESDTLRTYKHINTSLHLDSHCCTHTSICVIMHMFTTAIHAPQYVTGFTKTVLNRTFGNSRNTELKY